MFRWSDNCISNRSDRAADVSVVVSGWSKFFRLCCLCLFKTVCRIHVFKTAVATLWFYPHLLFRYTFYDGPPFATGLPHYGHILAGTIKDIVTRFAHQSGFHVDRRFGWDCHGLPVVRDPRLRRRPRETFRPQPPPPSRDSRACLAFSQEYEIDKTLGIKGPDDVAKMGIAEYNKQCRGIVMRYSKEWEVRVFQTSSILGTHRKLCLLIKFDCCCVVELLKLQWITLKWCSSCFSVKKSDLI